SGGGFNLSRRGFRHWRGPLRRLRNNRCSTDVGLWLTANPEAGILADWKRSALLFCIGLAPNVETRRVGHCPVCNSSARLAKLFPGLQREPLPGFTARA